MDVAEHAFRRGLRDWLEDGMWAGVVREESNGESQAGQIQGDAGGLPDVQAPESQRRGEDETVPQQPQGRLAA